MRKGFTLAEILIVLTIIGVMAVMTIPSLIQNSNSQQKIALFKKAFNAASNAYATEFAIKTPIQNSNDYAKAWRGFNNQLNIKYYYDSWYSLTKKIYTTPELNENDEPRYVMATEDGINYYVTHNMHAGVKPCIKKIELNSYKTSLEAVNHACIVVQVDINGFNKKPNEFCADDSDLNNLKNCDKIRLFLSKDGITAGNPDCTISGRIMSDNMEYDNKKCE